MRRGHVAAVAAAATYAGVLLAAWSLARNINDYARFVAGKALAVRMTQRDVRELEGVGVTGLRDDDRARVQTRDRLAPGGSSLRKY